VAISDDDQRLLDWTYSDEAHALLPFVKALSEIPGFQTAWETCQRHAFRQARAEDTALFFQALLDAGLVCAVLLAEPEPSSDEMAVMEPPPAPRQAVVCLAHSGAPQRAFVPRNLGTARPRYHRSPSRAPLRTKEIPVSHFPTSERKFLSITDGAARLGIGVTKFKELVRAGLIPTVKIGDRRLVPIETVDAYADSLTREHGTAS
jgi:excisionase family DNA binding protein